MIKTPTSLLTKVALGLGVSVVAPIVYRVVQSGEPLNARTLMKEGIKTYNQARIALAEAKENLSDLAAEAQAEADAAAERTYEGESTVVAEAEPGEAKG